MDLKSSATSLYDIYRTTQSINNIISTSYNVIIHSTNHKKLLEKSVEILESFPSENEMHGAVSGLFLLHQTYQLNWTNLVSYGVLVPPYFSIKRLKTDFKIYSKDFEVLGKIAYKRRFYDQAYELLNVSLYLAKRDGVSDRIRNIEILIDMVIKDHDQTLLKYRTYSRQGVYSHYLCTKMTNNTKDQVRIEKSNLNKRKIDLFTPFVTEKQKTDQFHSICRGERLRSHQDDIGLKSFFLHHGTPFLRLGPFKLEEKNRSPYVAVFHRFFHPKETNAFVKYASPDLERSETFVTEGNLGTSLSRTTKQVYVSENDTKFSEAGAVSDRINMATKLKARFWPKEESEEWQVVPYI